MVYVDYPRIKQSLGVAALRDAYPTSFFDMRGNICGINPLALWLVGALKVGEPFHPELLLGMNAFAVGAQQFHRIPVERNREFYTTRSAIVKRQDLRSQLTTYATFIAAMRADPVRAEIYESAPHHLQREWEYPLTIAHPDQPENMLEFYVNIYRLEGNGGFLLVNYPVKSTLPVIEEINTRLIESLGKVVSLKIKEQEQEPPEKMLNDTGYHTFYRDYYPRIIQDPLWYLSEENQAHRLMMNMSVVDMHFFRAFSHATGASLPGRDPGKHRSSCPEILYEFYHSLYARRA